MLSLCLGPSMFFMRFVRSLCRGPSVWFIWFTWFTWLQALKKKKKGGKAGGSASYVSMLVILTQLRLMTVHPLLPGYRFKKMFEKAVERNLTMEEMRSLSKKLSAMHKGIVCSICKVKAASRNCLSWPFGLW